MSWIQVLTINNPLHNNKGFGYTTGNNILSMCIKLIGYILIHTKTKKRVYNIHILVTPENNCLGLFADIDSATAFIRKTNFVQHSTYLHACKSNFLPVLTM